MTEKLYDKDAYLFSFSAQVISCSSAKNGYAVLLDRTAFFPEGGGQGADRGTLNGIPVDDVRLQGGDVVHYLSQPLAVGQSVAGELDRTERLRRMANHTGEHVLSGLVHAQFGWENVGFHLGDGEMTVDYGGPLTDDEVRQLERDANRVIRENRTVRAEYPSPEALARLDYRSKKPIAGPVRIVTVEGVDVCACCAPHVARTGEIGALVVTDRVNWKGGVRLKVRCADDAWAEYDRLRQDAAALSRLFSAPKGACFPAAEKLTEEWNEARRALNAARRAAALDQVARLAASDGNVCLFLPEADGDVLGAAADAGREKCTGYFVCLTEDGDGFRYAVAARGGLRQSIRQINADLQGRGGGDDRLARGRFAASREAILSYFRTEAGV